jgi:hypothetical protein
MKQPKKIIKKENIKNGENLSEESVLLFNVNQAVNIFQLSGLTREAMVIRHKNKDLSKEQWKDLFIKDGIDF